MSYATVQAGLIRAITNHANFSCSNTIPNDHRSLGDGSTMHAIIVFGGFIRQETSIQRVSHVWNFNVELYTAYRGEIEPSKTAESTKDNDCMHCASITKTPMVIGDGVRA